MPRKQLISACVSEKNRIQKIIEDANVKLGSVLTDIFGITGGAILSALECKLSAVEDGELGKEAGQTEDTGDHCVSGRASAHGSPTFSDSASLEHFRNFFRLPSRIKGRGANQDRSCGKVPSNRPLLQTLPGIREEAAAGTFAEMGRAAAVVSQRRYRESATAGWLRIFLEHNFSERSMRNL